MEVTVLGAEYLPAVGRFFSIDSEEIHDLSRSEVMVLFGDSKTITLTTTGQSFPITAIEPMYGCFAGKTNALILVEADSLPAGIYPTPAVIE